MGHTDRLELTEEEAYTLLSLCLLSEAELCRSSEAVINKLAGFCRNHLNTQSDHSKLADHELQEAG